MEEEDVNLYHRDPSEAILMVVQMTFLKWQGYSNEKIADIYLPDYLGEG